MIGPVIEDVRITRPWPERSSAGRQAWTETMQPLRFVPITSSIVLVGHVRQALGREDAGVGAEHVDAPVALDRRGRDRSQSARRATSAST